MVRFKTSFYRKYIEPYRLELSNIECAYLAGIVDADGSISVSRITSGRRYPTYRVVVEVCNQSKELIEWLRSKFPKYNLRMTRRGVYIFTIYHIGLLWHLLPKLTARLVLKQRQGELALRALELKYKYWRTTSKRYYEEMNQIHLEVSRLNRGERLIAERLENTHYDDAPEEELYAYLAGVLDGDGAVSINKHGRVTIHLSTVSKGYALWLRDRIDESEVYYLESTGVWTVVLTHEYLALELLEKLSPYIIVKRKRIETILDRFT